MTKRQHYKTTERAVADDDVTNIKLLRLEKALSR